MHPDPIGEKIKALPDIPLPGDLHERIMKRMARAQLRMPFLIALSLLGLNVTLSAWHVWTRMTQLETLSIFRALMEGFAFTTDFMEDAVAAAHQFIPLSSLAMFLINGIIVIYGLYFYRMAKRREIFS